MLPPEQNGSLRSDYIVAVVQEPPKRAENGGTYAFPEDAPSPVPGTGHIYVAPDALDAEDAVEYIRKNIEFRAGTKLLAVEAASFRVTSGLQALKT